jgi:hypothetical protein
MVNPLVRSSTSWHCQGDECRRHGWSISVLGVSGEVGGVGQKNHITSTNNYRVFSIILLVGSRAQILKYTPNSWKPYHDLVKTTSQKTCELSTVHEKRPPWFLSLHLCSISALFC